MKDIYQNLVSSTQNGNKLLAVLIDPDKVIFRNLSSIANKINQSMANYIFVGGSTVKAGDCENVVSELKKHTDLPVVLFPGDVSQITPKADGILFLSLISGRNPDYLIGKHVKSISELRSSNLEVIPTGYILIENGKKTSVQKVSGTQPLSRKNIEEIVDTAKAGELLGMKLIYLEAGSGALNPVNSEIINRVKSQVNIPIIVGGGIRKKEQLENAYNSGADLVVIGTAFEEDESFLINLIK